MLSYNNNPETVSTDFDTADRLYFEPLTTEDVTGYHQYRKAVRRCGSIRRTDCYQADKASVLTCGVNILGTPHDDIDAAEDRERFDELLEKCHIKRPRGVTVMTTDEALEAAETTRLSCTSASVLCTWRSEYDYRTLPRRMLRNIWLLFSAT